MLYTHLHFHPITGKVVWLPFPLILRQLCLCHPSLSLPSIFVFAIHLPLRMRDMESDSRDGEMHTIIRRLLRSSYTEHKTKEYVREQVGSLARKQEPLLPTVKRRNALLDCHITRQYHFKNHPARHLGV